MLWPCRLLNCPTECRHVILSRLSLQPRAAPLLSLVYRAVLARRLLVQSQWPLPRQRKVLPLEAVPRRRGAMPRRSRRQSRLLRRHQGAHGPRGSRRWGARLGEGAMRRLGRHRPQVHRAMRRQELHHPPVRQTRLARRRARRRPGHWPPPRRVVDRWSRLFLIPVPP